jgi:hypothetical protein
MPSPRAELVKLQRSLQRLNYTRHRMEKLFSVKRISKTDLDSVYEALFLRAVTSFEVFLEDLFVAILEGRARYSRNRVRVLMSASSRDDLMRILLQNNAYMNWLPFNNAERRAKIYLKDGRPFSDLSDGDKSILKTITVIRNAIAHKSAHALSEFNRTVTGALPLLHNERSPAGFLRSRITSGPAQSRFEVYMGELGRCAGLIC